MKPDYGRLFGRMCDLRGEPPLLFAIPELEAEVCQRVAYLHTPVELVVPDLDAFCVPEADLERIQWAVDAALAWDAGTAPAPPGD